MKLNRASKFSILATVMVLALLMSSSLAFAAECAPGDGPGMDVSKCCMCLPGVDISDTDICVDKAELTITKNVIVEDGAAGPAAGQYRFSIQPDTGKAKTVRITGVGKTDGSSKSKTRELASGTYTISEKTKWTQGADVISYDPADGVVNLKSQVTGLDFSVTNTSGCSFPFGWRLMYHPEQNPSDVYGMFELSMLNSPFCAAGAGQLFDPLNIDAGETKNISVDFDGPFAPGFYQFAAVYPNLDWIPFDGYAWSNPVEITAEDLIPPVDACVTVTNTFKPEQPEPEVFGNLNIYKFVEGPGPVDGYEVSFTGPVGEPWCDTYTMNISTSNPNSFDASLPIGTYTIEETEAQDADLIEMWYWQGSAFDAPGTFSIWEDFTTEVAVRNTFNNAPQPDFGTLHIKKIVEGPGVDGPYSVSLCQQGPPEPRVSLQASEMPPSLPILPDYPCVLLPVYEGENSFANEDNEFEGNYFVSESQINDTHTGYRVFAADSEWNYDENSPIAGEGNYDSYNTASVPININPLQDTYLVVVNYFEEEQPFAIINKIVKGDAPEDASFYLTISELIEGEWVEIPRAGMEIFEGENIIEDGPPHPGTFKIEESCFPEDPREITYSQDTFTVTGEYQETIVITLTNDYTEESSRRHRRSGGGGIVEEFPTPPPLTEPIIVADPQPTAPAVEVVEVPAEPAPELPKTGAPLAAGLGLILAAGGLAVTRMKK